MKTTKSGKGLKEFPSWNQFVAIIFLPVRPGSLIVRNLWCLASCMGKPKYIGIDNASYRSTLSCVNEKRPWRLYEAVFYRLLGKARGIAPTKKKFCFRNRRSNLIAMVRYNLFTYRNLWGWIDCPPEVPPIIPYREQLALEF